MITHTVHRIDSGGQALVDIYRDGELLIGNAMITSGHDLDAAVNAFAAGLLAAPPESPATDTPTLSPIEQALIDRKEQLKRQIVALLRSTPALSWADLASHFAWNDMGLLAPMLRTYVGQAVALGLCPTPADNAEAYWSTIRSIILASTDEQLAEMLGGGA